MPREVADTSESPLFLERLHRTLARWNTRRLRPEHPTRRWREDLEEDLRMRTLEGEWLEAEHPDRTTELVLADLQSLTRKPTLFVCNVAESDLERADELLLVKKVRELSRSRGSKAVVISARLESELALLADVEAKAYLASHGLRESRAASRPGGGWRVCRRRSIA